MKEEHLDLLVTEAILARLERPDFLPALGEGDQVREEEREALLAEIAELQAWLEKVRERALDERDLDLLFDQERRVKPKISELQERAKELTSLDPVVKKLAEAENIRVHWEALSLEDQRRVIRMLVVPAVDRATPGTRGRKGPRPDRLRLHWR